MLGISSGFRSPAKRRMVVFAGSFCALVGLFPSFAETAFRDPLDTPAEMRTNAAQRPLMAIARAGGRLVAVGSRGLIVVSDDQGETWEQMNVPVQSDLLTVHFPSPQKGWVVGHEGVVLHSADGGSTWVKQLDGRSMLDAFNAYYAKLPPSPEIEAAIAQLDLNYRSGPVLPWLDVWFEDEETGYAVGSFGMLIATRDGGQSWEPWLERIDNSEYLNLNAIRGISGELFIVGERGQIYRLDRVTRRFGGIDTGYIGSFFGIVGNDSTLIAFGLRGTAFRSDDYGVNWRELSISSEQTITAGLSVSGGVVLGNIAGQLLQGDWSSQSLRLAGRALPIRITGMIILDDGTLVLTGLDGVHVKAVNAALGGS